MRTTSNAFRLTYLAILTAIVIVLQLLGSFIKFGPFEVSLVLLPIVLGVVTGGPWAGAWLGLVFGVCVLVSPSTQLFMSIHIFGTILTVLLKGVLCGLAAGWTYWLLRNKNKYFAIFSAAVVCPIVNTGIFLLGTRLFFWDTIAVWAAADGTNAWGYLILTMIGANFLFELLFNVILCPVLLRLMNATKLERFLK
ncbi:MAG: ECF transporter S component [Clostridia bacterium]|nr:ECF transporter S component [Clostridia bacterium]